MMPAGYASPRREALDERRMRLLKKGEANIYND
jgi:hypothetical protein